MRPVVRAMVGAASIGLAVLLAPGLASGQSGTARVGPPEGAVVRWQQVTAGDRHSCGITTAAVLYCWGWDGAGQLGDGGTNTDMPTPSLVAGNITNWVSVSAGGSHTCGTTSTGHLFCWGSDADGQLGNGGENTDASEPVEVAGGNRFWAQVSAGYQHTCARSRAGRLFCWGNDGSGRLGDDTDVASENVPTEVAGGASNWAQVAAGAFHTCATRQDGRLFCWGLDSAGQLGDDAELADHHIPVEVVGGATNWAQVDVGRSHTCAVKTSERLYCWGWDGAGQQGDGPELADHATPVRVGRGTYWLDVTAGGYNACARGSATLGASSGQLFCWGLDQYGELGDDANLANQPSPVPLARGGTGWASEDAGEYHVCAIKRSGRLFCWGLDSNGQLGDDVELADQPTPVPVA